MLKDQIRKAVSWLPHLMVICGAMAFAFVLWPQKRNWPEWRPSMRIPADFVESRPGILAWKEPILPAQFAQGTCGACHQEDLPQTPQLNHGRQLIVRYNCIACHRLQGIDRPEMLAPDLTNISVKVSREWIYKWLKDPRSISDAEGNQVVDGVYLEPRMPKFQLTDVELRAISAYLITQRRKPITRSGSYRTAAGHVNEKDAEDGKTRFNQMFCVTCHALAVTRGGETKLIGGDIGPELTKVGSKVNPDWLSAWLSNPGGYLRHTGMPQYDWSQKDLHVVTQFILGQLTDPDLLKDVPKLAPPTPAEVQAGERVFREKGCAQCHVIEGVEPSNKFGPDLSALAMAGGPFVVDVKYKEGASASLHFVKSDTKELEVGVSQIPHSMITYIQRKINDPASLASEPHMPRFHMSQSDLDDVTTALLSMSGPPIKNAGNRSMVIERTHAEFHPGGRAGELFHRYKCYQCHRFDGFGGTLAPDLSYEGSRSQRDWIVDFLQNPQTLRPTLTVRMPNFNMSKEEASVLADGLIGPLRNTRVKEGIEATEFSAEMAERGKKLYEQKYACQSCHTIGSTGGYVGPSLTNVGNWLRPEWMDAWLENPQSLVPGVIEPRHSFSTDEKKDVTAYLLTLKQNPSGDFPSPLSAREGQR